MARQRHLPEHFTWKGDRFAFHRIADGSTLGRLDPYSEAPQVWPLHSGRKIEVTGADVRDITFQVHGIQLPETKPVGGSCVCDEARIAALEDKVSLLLQLAGAKEAPETEQPPQAAPEPAPTPEAPVVPDELAQRRRQVHKLKAEIEALKKQLADAAHDNDALKDRIGELEAELAKANEPPPLLPDPTTSMLEFDESFKPLRGLMEDGETVSMAKKRLYPRLMEELQNLKNQEALFDKTIPRRAEVEQLLGILARVGEH